MARVRGADRTSVPFPVLPFSFSIPFIVATVPFQRQPVSFTFALALGGNTHPDPLTFPFAAFPFVIELYGTTADGPVAPLPFYPVSFSVNVHPLPVQWHTTTTDRSLPRSLFSISVTSILLS